MRSSVCRVSIQFRGLLRLAGELVCVCKFRFHIWTWIANSFQSGNGSTVVSSFPIETCERPQNFWIVGGTLLGHLQIAFGVVELFHSLIVERQQHFPATCGLQPAGPLQRSD